MAARRAKRPADPPTRAPFRAQTGDEVQPSSAPTAPTLDAFANPAAKLGIDQQTLLAGSTYNFNPISRNRLLLENAYRGSWIVRQAVDIIPEDMTREGITIKGSLAPEIKAAITTEAGKKNLWGELNAGLRWARLYGGAIVLVEIDGQDNATPLRTETIGKGQFKGLRAFDRWMLEPSLSAGELIHEAGPKQGLPVWYNLTVQAGGIPRGRLHHTRCIRFEGADLPFFQRQMENLWGLSVLEPLWDRLMAFDSATIGAAQLVFKAHLRTIYLQNYRQAAAIGGPSWNAILKAMEMIRLYQHHEGLTVLDAADKMEYNQYSFAGLDSVMVQFAHQLSGALGIPMVRLFGQSPGGLDATGASDIRNFYDRIKELQESELRQPVSLILQCEHRSQTGQALPDDCDFEFQPLWQLNDSERIEIAQRAGAAVAMPFSQGLVDKATALKELKQSSEVTGVWGHISDEDIAAAEAEPPPIPELPGFGHLEQPREPQQLQQRPRETPALEFTPLHHLQLRSLEMAEPREKGTAAGEIDDLARKVRPATFDEHDLRLLVGLPQFAHHDLVHVRSSEGMVAYHGTRYRFDKFSLGALRTGEGRTSFGAGLYFAEDPEVAEYYEHKIGGEHGYLYTVHLEANPDRFIDYDKPFADQSAMVRSALSRLGFGDIVPFSITPGFAQQLREQGIVGARYLDQFSRAQGVGTHDFVVFDPSIIHVISREGGVCRFDALHRKVCANGEATSTDAYDPNQPRAPEGSSEGGQWTAGGGRGKTEAAEEKPKLSREDFERLIQESKKKVEQKAEHVRLVKEKAEATAKLYGFPEDKISFRTDDYMFTVNGMPYTAAGLHHSDTGKIEIFPNEIQDPDTVSGIMAHEIMHHRFDTVMHRRSEEYQAILKEEDPTRDLMHAGTGLLKPPYDKKYPVYQALTEFESGPKSEGHNAQSMIERDAISPYADAYCKEWLKGAESKVNTPQVYHECLAEIARKHHETGIITGPKPWADFYKLVQKAYRSIE
jgi:uncharacterized protein